MVPRCESIGRGSKKTVRRSILLRVKKRFEYICNAYRTVSGPAVQVVAGVIKIDRLADEHRRIYLRIEEGHPDRIDQEGRTQRDPAKMA